MAKTIKGITIELEGKTSGLVKSLSEVDKQLKTTKDALKDVDAALKLDPKNLDVLVSKQKLLDDAIEETKKKLELEQQAAEKAKDALALGQITEADYATVISNVSKTTSELEKMKDEAVDVAAKIDTIDSAPIEEVGSEAQNSKKKMADLSDAVKTLKDSLMKVSSFARSFLTGAVNSAMEYESAFAGVMKTVDETDTTTYDDISDAIKQMAEETGTAKSEIAGVAAAAGQLGIATDNIAEFTKTMVMMGDATDLTAQDAAVALAQFINVTGGSQDTIDNLGAAIVALGNSFATNEPAIVEMSQRLAASGRLAGLSETDILALATAMSSVGIKAEAGGTAMTQTLNAISKAVDGIDNSLEDVQKAQKAVTAAERMLSDAQSALTKKQIAYDSAVAKNGKESEKAQKALVDLESAQRHLEEKTQDLSTAQLVLAELTDGSSSKLEEIARISGMSADEFSKAFKENSIVALQAFITGLGKLDENGESTIAVLDGLEMSGVRQAGMLQSLALASDVLTEAVEMSEEAYTENLALQKEAETRYSTTERQVMGTKEAFDNLKVELGETLLPVLTDLLEIAKDVVDWFKGLDDDTKELIGKFVLFTAAIGPAITAISGIVTIVGAASTVIGALGTGLTGIAVAGGPIALAIAGFASLASIIGNVVDMYEGWESMQAAKEQAERLSKASTEAREAQIKKMTENPYEGLWAAEGSTERAKAEAAYRLMGLDPAQIRAQNQAPIVVNSTVQIDGETVGQATTRQRSSMNQRLLGGAT